jgi:hypothetical protein
VTRPRALGLAIAIGLVARVQPAHATECDPSSGLSSCFDPDNLWLSAGPSRFVSIASGKIAPAEKPAFAAGLTYLSRPVVLVAPSPDPDGREIRVVNEALNLTTAWAFAPSSSWELTLAMPMTLNQSGAGAEGYTSQSGPPLDRATVRDPRVGVGIPLPAPASWEDSSRFGAKARLELGLPLGNEESFSGARTVTGAASVAASFHAGRLFGAGELGVRLRPTTRFATAKLGSSALTAVGLGVDILGDELLSLAAEAWMLPVLVSQPGRSSASTEVKDGLLVPAEWLASFRSAPTSDKGFALQLGGGTGIPLSSETRDGTTEQFAGVTTPRFRLVFNLRYDPGRAAVRTRARARR